MIGRHRRRNGEATLARLDEVMETVRHIHYAHNGESPWTFYLQGNTPDDAWLQVGFYAEDTRNGKGRVRQTGREWRISPWMGPNEIVKTALAAVLAAVQHEALEGFTYRGEQLFHPHYDVETLAEVCQQPWA